MPNFKNIYKYTSYYQATFNKVVCLLMDIFFYTCKSIEMYFQAMILINIGMEYFAFILTIQKKSKDNNTNLVEVVLQIIQYFKFIEENKRSQEASYINNFLQTFTPSTNYIPKSSYINLKYVDKGLTTHYTNYC